MFNVLLIIFGKFIAFASRALNFGNGSTWPGHIALSINKNIIKDILKTNSQRLTTILIAGTNGKTTTGKLIQTILEKNGKRVFQNAAGANLLNGIASSLITNSNLSGRINKDFAIFEIDENTLPHILKEITNPDYIIILNLFRDQLDRYGEVNTIANKWKDAIRHLPSTTTLILNADDPQIASLGMSRCIASIPHPMWKNNVLFFGINSKNKTEKTQYASDSTYCPNCGHKLIYDSIYFSHLGDWHCDNCGFRHPEKIFTSSPLYPLTGTYNEYNTNASVLLAQALKFSKNKVISSLEDFKPAFGRQEIINAYGKRIQIFLSKNPTSFNESLKTIVNLKAKNVLIVLNDRIPDGLDVSWIWDVDTEEYVNKFNSVVISGDRAFDMGLRIKYSYSSEFPISNFQFPINSQNSNSKFQIIENLEEAIFLSLKNTPKSETLYILPTYSAMLEVRKILTGKKIL